MADAEVKKKLKGKTPEFRGSFVRLVTPKAVGDGEPKFSMTMALPKSHPFWPKLEAQVKLAAEQKFDGKVPKGFKSPIRDGDETEYADFQGCYFINLSSTDRPGVVDTELEPITDRSELYSGAWYRASFRVYAWHYKEMNNRGASVQLDNVQKVRDDQAFSGKATAADDFADDVDTAGDGESLTD